MGARWVARGLRRQLAEAVVAGQVGLFPRADPPDVTRKVVQGARVVALAPDGGPPITSIRYQGCIVLAVVDGLPRPRWRVRGWTAGGELVGCPCDAAGADMGPGEIVPAAFGGWMRKAVADRAGKR